MHQLWNYAKSTIISHFHTNCKFSPNLMMHTKRKCKCSKIVDPTAIKIIQMCLCDWLFVELELIKLTQEKKTQMATALLNALDLTRCLSRLPFFILANIYFFCFLFSWCMHWLISRWMSRAMWSRKEHLLVDNSMPLGFILQFWGWGSKRILRTVPTSYSCVRVRQLY